MYYEIYKQFGPSPDFCRHPEGCSQIAPPSPAAAVSAHASSGDQTPSRKSKQASQAHPNTHQDGFNNWGTLNMAGFPLTF